MWYLWSLRCLLLHLIIVSFYLSSVKAVWSSSSSSSIQLLAVIQESTNTSDTLYAVQAYAMFKAALLLSQQYNITVGGEFIGWQTTFTNGNPIRALRSTCMAVSNSNIVGIVGPGLSREAQVIAPFGETIGVSVVSFAATDPDLSDRDVYPNFYRTIPSDTIAGVAIAQLFLRFNWTSCIFIYQNDAYGLGGLKAITEAFKKNNLTVEDTIEIDTVANGMRNDLKQELSNSPTRIIVIWADPIYKSMVLQSAMDNDLLGPQYIWILDEYIPFEHFNETDQDKLIGILTVEPVVASVVGALVNTTLLNAALDIWRTYELETFPGEANIDDYALFAFDATWLLILALQKYCSTQSSPCLPIANSSFCFDRLLLNSTSFLDTISTTTFLGVSGQVQCGVNVTDRIQGTYYYSRNVQRSTKGLDYVPVLLWSSLHNWIGYSGSTVIVWPGNTLAYPSGHAKLEGISLRIAISALAPFTEITNVIDQYGNSTIKYIGYIPDLIDLLQKQMNFIPELILINAPYLDIINDVRNGIYDIFMADTTITAARRQIADFSDSIFDNALCIMVRKKPDVTIDLLSFLRPFTRNLWLLILAATVYAALLLFIYEGRTNDALRHKSITSSAAMSGWFCFGTLMGYGVDFEVRTAAGRLLTTGLYILSLILVATYTANLASNLTLLKAANVISGIDDIRNGKIPFSRVGLRNNTASEQYYLQEVSRGIQNFYVGKTVQELIDSLLNGVIDAYILDSGVAEYLTGNVYCNLTLVGDPFNPTSFGIVTPKGWIYAEELDVTILSFQETGELDNLRKTWFPPNNCPDTSSTSVSMGIETMCGLLLVFAVISVLSWLLFLWQKRYTMEDYLVDRGHIKVTLNEKTASKTNRSKKEIKPLEKSPVTLYTIKRLYSHENSSV